MQNSTKRNTNFELLRIICMLMIITWHYIIHTKLLSMPNITTINFILLTIIKYICIVAVNCYVLISGYYLCKSKFKVKKVLKLIGTVIFYSAGIQLIFYITGQDNSKLNLFNSFFPFITSQYWFFTTYIFMYIISPFLNIVIAKINKVQFKFLIAILFICASVIKTIYPYNTSIGGNALFFIMLYFIAAYIRLFDENKTKKVYWLILYFVFVIALVAVEIMTYNIFEVSNVFLNYLHVMNGNHNILVVLSSISLFMFFKNVNIKKEKVKSVICKIAPLTFGIYLIHDHNLVRKLLWSSVNADKYINTSYIFIHILEITIIIFSVCAIIEFIRKIVFKQIGKVFKNNKFINKIEYKLEKIDNVINEELI